MYAEEKYQAELKQSDLDHHQPTAAAMTGHIISNLLIHSLKINQANLFAKGSASLFLAEKATGWIAYERQEFDQLSHLLVNNGESIPTITAQFKEYTMPEEDKQAVEPVDGDNRLAPFESIDYADGNFTYIKLHREITALYHRGLDESRTYVGDMNIADISYSRQLAEAFEIMTGESL